MLERISSTITRHGLFAPGQRVGVAVSGGADSVCLLHTLLELAPKWKLKLAVLHVNHQLRGNESDADEEFVRALAFRLGFEFHCCRRDVRRLALENRDNLEQTARLVRREFFLDFLKQGLLDRVALGHTRSDQAETVLFRFLRGTGTAGLAGMRAATSEGIVRPLIETARGEIHQYLLENGIRWREDSSNADPAFARNRIRRELLPALERDWNKNLPETLAGVARAAQDEEDYWRGEVDQAVEGRLSGEPPALLFRTDWVLALPAALRRRVIRRVIERAKGDLRAIDLLHVERILELIAAPDGSGRLQVPGLDVFRSFDWVRLAPPGMDTLEDRDYSMKPEVPCRLSLPHWRTVLAFEVTDSTGATNPPQPPANHYNREESQLDWGRLSGRLQVRNWRPGDHYRPLGHVHDTKIKLLFQQARVPLWERRRWPVITCQDSIVWAARFGPAAEFAPGAGTESVLKVRELVDSPDF